MAGETTTTDVRTVIGTLSTASVRHNESLEIDSMNVGEPGSCESADSHPIIRIDIQQPLPNGRDSLRMGTVTARPIYDDADDFDRTTTEAQLEQTLTGYQVRVELRTNVNRSSWPPFGIDYHALGFVVAGDDEHGVHDFRAYTEPIPFEDAVDLLDETMDILRNHREQ